MKVLLEDSWEADDVIQYCKDRNIECVVLSPAEILKRDDFFESVYLCGTDTVRRKLEEKGRLDLIPDTYENIYSEFFHRRINKVLFGNIIKELESKDGRKEIFVKPITNDKSFDGKVISCIDDFEMYGESKPNEDTIVYTSEVVKFVSEVRLLIGNGKLYGHGHICKAKSDLYLKEMNIQKLIDLTGNNFRCIDIGMVMKPAYRWMIIEINPPFALDDHQIPLADYMEFCIDACKYINNSINANMQ